MSYSVSRPLPLADTPEVMLVTPDEAHELEAMRAIFRDYAATLGIDLGFQNFEGELAALPGDYAEPRGALLLALVDVGHPGAAAGTPTVQRANGKLAHVAGCCALRPLDAADYPNAAEMKRLFVRPGFRGLGLGRQLAEAMLDAARSAGYSCVLLDTLDDMESARALYEDLGFAERGTAYKEVLAGTYDLNGDLPINPDGGLKSFGHPVGASGLRMMFEAWLQLRGEGHRTLGYTANKAVPPAGPARRGRHAILSVSASY